MIQYRPRLIAALALPAAALLAACGSASPPSAARTTAPATAAPAATTSADPCEALITWRDSGGITSLREVARALGAVSTDELRANAASLDGDGRKLYAAALAAQDDPPPFARGQYLKAMRLAGKAAVFAQSGNYQASTTAITETGDLFSAMTSDMTGQCG
jgi:hypothetical protein